MLTCILGGRTTPFMSNYRPQCFIRTADITAALTFPEGTPDAHEKMVAFSAIVSFMVPRLKDCLAGTSWRQCRNDLLPRV